MAEEMPYMMLQTNDTGNTILTSVQPAFPNQEISMEEDPSSCGADADERTDGDGQGMDVTDTGGSTEKGVVDEIDKGLCVEEDKVDRLNNADHKEVEYVDTRFEQEDSTPLHHPKPLGRKNEHKTKRKMAVRKAKKKSTETLDKKSTGTKNKKSAKTKDEFIPVKIEEEVIDEFQCDHCNMVFRYEKQLNSHRLVCGGVESFDVPIIPTKKISKTHRTCPVCQETFSKPSCVKRHLSMKHSNLVHISCALCSKKIGDIHNNFQHFQEAHKIPRAEPKKKLTPGTSHCPVCASVFTKPRYMKQHLVNTHSDLIHVTCALCHRPVGTMLEYLQHFVRYHSHSSVTCDKNKEVVTTDIEKAMKNKDKMESNEARYKVAPSSEKTDLVCPQCNKCLENYKLLALHVLSHKIEENTNIVTQKSIIQTYSMANSNSDKSSSSTNVTGSNEFICPPNLSYTQKPATSEYPLPVWCLPPDSLGDLSCVSSVLGPDLLASINCSLNIITDMATQLVSELHWKDQDYVATKEDLVKRLNKVLLFSSSVMDITKCVLLVLEESSQFRCNPFIDNVNIADAFDEEIVQDEDDVEVCDGKSGSEAWNNEDLRRKEIIEVKDDDDEFGKNGTEVQNEDFEDGLVGNNEQRDFTTRSENKGLNVEHASSQKGTYKNRLSSSSPLSSELTPVVELQQQSSDVDLGSGSGSQRGRRKRKMKVLDSAREITAVSLDDNKPLNPEASASSSSTLDKPLPKGVKKQYICRMCGKHLSKQSSLSKHLAIHSTARPFKCKICSAGFKTEDHLKRHILSHQNDKQYKCDFCDFGCRTIAIMRKHNLTEHPQSSLFSCDQCKHQAKTSHDLALHKKTHEPRKCKLCDFEARHQNELNAHERKNHANKQCPECSYRCLNDHDLKRHMRTHVKSELEKIFCCDLCGAMFDTKRKLDYHVIRHTNKTPLSCKLCDYKCSSKQTLATHMLKHSGLKPYKCQLCDASFYRQSYLNHHMRKHSDEKEFCCKYCGKGFKYRYNCLEHEMIHTGEKKFKCKYCQFACQRRKVLDQHMAEHKGRSSDGEGVSGDEVGPPVDLSYLMLRPEYLAPLM